MRHAFFSIFCALFIYLVHFARIMKVYLNIIALDTYEEHIVISTSSGQLHLRWYDETSKTQFFQKYRAEMGPISLPEGFWSSKSIGIIIFSLFLLWNGLIELWKQLLGIPLREKFSWNFQSFNSSDHEKFWFQIIEHIKTFPNWAPNALYSFMYLNSRLFKLSIIIAPTFPFFKIKKENFDTLNLQSRNRLFLIHLASNCKCKISVQLALDTFHIW